MSVHFDRRSRCGRAVHTCLAALAFAVAVLTGTAPNAAAATSAPTPTEITHPDQDYMGSGLQRLIAEGRPPASAVGGPSGSGLSPNTSGAPQGLDVSAYQGSVDWNSVKSNGASFAYVKATESTTYTNPDFAQQYNGSYNVGLIRGAYHFAVPSDSGGAAQADYFVANGGGWSADGQTLPGALDIEYNPYGSECYGLSQSSMRSWISAFVNEYHAKTNRWAVIYSTYDWWNTCTGSYSGLAANDPLWIACYCSSAGTMPAGWPYETFWQYADSGLFPGDQDLFNGDATGLQNLATGNPPTGPVKLAIASLCLDDKSDGSADGNIIDIWTCNGTAAQNWSINLDKTLRVNGKCLDVKGQGTSNGTLVDLWTCNGGANQEWTVGSNNSLVGVQSGKCLDDPGSSTTNGTQLQIYTCNGTNAQNWTLP